MNEKGNNRVEEFLDLYKQLEESLEEKYRKARRKLTGSVVSEFLRDRESEAVREKLNTCREIRNLLTHSADLAGEPVVEPSLPVVQALRETVEYVRRPPLAMDFATKGDEILKADLGQKVLRVMEQMEKNGYSHIPVTENGEFCGVFSSGSVFRYQLLTGGKPITRETTLRDLGRVLEIGEHPENYEFLPRDATYRAVRSAFEKVRGKNRRVSVVFLTETGKPGQRLLGMLTPWDVLKEE